MRRPAPAPQGTRVRFVTRKHFVSAPTGVQDCPVGDRRVGLAGEDPAVLPRVNQGVFFRPLISLPRGRHNLGRDEVLEAQRERLMAAVTELIAAHGFLAVRVGDISARAGVSRAAFYACFETKEQCVFAAYDRFIEVLLGRLGSLDPTAAGDDFLAQVVEEYLTTLQQDLVVARAFQVEIDALGTPARSRRRSSLMRFAQFLHAAHQRHVAARPELRSLSVNALLGLVYATRQITSDALDESAQPDLLALLPDLVEWTGVMWNARDVGAPVGEG